MERDQYTTNRRACWMAKMRRLQAELGYAELHFQRCQDDDCERARAEGLARLHRVAALYYEGLHGEGYN